MKKDLISITDLTVNDIKEILNLTEDIKRKGKRHGCPLIGKSVALIFQKPSMRTRVSFEVGMYELGGASVYLGPEEVGLGAREEIEDVARVISRYVNGVILRTFKHSDIVEFAKYADVPVINGLSDLEHPAQIISDLYTIKEEFGKINNLSIGYIGDGNNVCNSLIQVCAKLNIALKVATPRGYEPIIPQTANRKPQTASVMLTHNPKEAARGADVLYTDVWASMGQEKEATKRRKAFSGYRVDKKLLKLAKPDCKVLHCLPAHRGEEITDEVIESPNSIIFEQAENRLHSSKAILEWLLCPKK